MMHCYMNGMDDIMRPIDILRVQEKLDEINSIHPKLKFTHEIEKDGKLPFLDMEIIHIGLRLESRWYNKPTDTGVILNFHAQAPNSYKRNLVQGFVHRIFNTCSSWDHFNESLDKAKKVLENNQYPSTFYLPIIEETVEKILRPPIEASQTKRGQVQGGYMLLIQYRGHPTEQFIKKLKQCNAPVSPVITLRKLKTVLPSLKAVIPMPVRSHVVYQVSCPGCGACNVGQTARH